MATQSSARSQRENLTPPQRVGELVSCFAMVLVLAFFVYHQVANTGFSTAEFGPWEMFFFYGPMLLAFTPPLARALSGRRQPSRPLDVATNVFVAMGALWLLIIFPFEFTHLADALPQGLQFLLAWVNNDIGRIILILQLIIAPIAALAITWQFIRHYQREPGGPPQLPAAV